MAKSKKGDEKTADKPNGLAALHALLRDKYPDALTTQSVVSIIPTGSAHLDRQLGVGGFPLGKIVEIYGQESGGKSTLALSVCAQAQKLGHCCVYLDYEHAIDLDYAKAIGVDVSPSRFIWVQPSTHEEGSKILREAVESGLIKIAVWDSVAAAVPEAELEGTSGEIPIGLQARLNGQLFRQITGLLAEHQCLLIAINQLRMKVGVIYGSPETTTGGNALKFYSSIRIDLRKKETIKEGETAVGIRSRAKIVKNKVAPPFKEAEFNIVFGQGIDQASDVLDIAVESGKIIRAGAWYALTSTGEKIGQGQANALNWLRANESKWVELKG